MKQKTIVISLGLVLCAVMALAQTISYARKQKEQKMFQGLRTVIYHVNDLAKAKAWYADVLGVKPYFDEPFYVGFNVGGYELGLDPDAKDTKQGANVVAYWGVRDVKTTYAELLKKGARKHGEPREVGDGIITATVEDPFGNVFGIIENPHFKIDSSSE